MLFTSRNRIDAAENRDAVSPAISEPGLSAVILNVGRGSVHRSGLSHQLWSAVGFPSRDEDTHNKIWLIPYHGKHGTIALLAQS